MDGDDLFYGQPEIIESVSDFSNKYLSAEERWMIENPEHWVSREYVQDKLSLEKRAIIKTGAQDEIIFAIIEVMVGEERKRQEREKTEGRQPLSRFSLFDCLFPNSKENYIEYILMNRDWILEEQTLAHITSQEQLNEDSKKNLNGCRARVYFSIKYPDKMELQHKLPQGCSRRIPCARKDCILRRSREGSDSYEGYSGHDGRDFEGGGNAASARLKKLIA